MHDNGMYMFTKLHLNVHKCGGKTKFGAKNDEWTKAVNSTTLLQY